MNRSQITFQYYDHATRPAGFVQSKRFDDSCDFLHDGKVHGPAEMKQTFGRRTGYKVEEHIPDAFKAMEERAPVVLSKRPSEFTPKPREYDIVVPWRRNPFAQ